MAIKSALNPGAIVNERPTSLSAATNFITGGAPLGESILSSAANKIVGFEKPGSAAVAPRSPDLGSIISTLSSSILNNVENRLQSVNQNVVNIVNNKLQTLESDYAERLSKVDSDKPNNILKNFLSLYRDAIGFIQFLGNKKNIKTLGSNLDALRKVFEESFGIAKIIRQTIIKIVDQLSNLPTSDAAGGGGLNLDIKIPGSNVIKQTAPKGLTKNIGKFGKAALIGGAAVGAGALGSQVVNGMMDVGSVNAAPTGDQYGGLSGPILDKFNGILDKFAAAIANFANGQKEQSGSQKSSTSASPGEPPSTEQTLSSAPGDQKLAAFTATMEASSPENAADALQVMLNRNASGYSKQGLAGVISGKDQFSPISAAIYGTSADKAAAAKYGPIAEKLGKTPEERFKKLQEIASQPDGLDKLQQLFGGGSASVAGTILNDPKYLEESRKNVKNALNFYGGKPKKSGDVQIRPGGNVFYNYTGKVGSLQNAPTATTAPTKPQVSAAPSKSTTAQEVSKQVSQVPGTNKSPKSSVVPVDLTNKEQVQNKPATVVQRPVMSTGGTDVPNLNSSNDNNFFTLFARTQYGIVH